MAKYALRLRFLATTGFDAFGNLPHRLLTQKVTEVVEESNYAFVFLKVISPRTKKNYELITWFLRQIKSLKF